MRSVPLNLPVFIIYTCRITERIQKKYPLIEINEDTFSSPFMNLEGKNVMKPALEFVKSVCQVKYY